MKWFSIDIEDRKIKYDPLSLKGSITDIAWPGVRAYGNDLLVSCHQLAVL
jgi:hypothetical protein